MAADRTVAELALVNREVEAGTAPGQTAASQIPPAAHEVNGETAEPAETAEANDETVVAAEPTLSWTQAADPLCRRDSQHRRQHHQVHRSGRDPCT